MLRLAVLVSLAGLLIGGCGGGDALRSDGALRAAATVEYSEYLHTVAFWPSDLEFGADDWATHMVGFEIITDDWVQHLSLHDHYLVDGDRLVPAPDATLTDYTLSDQGPFGASFTVDVDDPVADGHRASLLVPISLEPSPGVQGALESREVQLTIDLVYHLWHESDEVDPGFRTAEELERATIDGAQELWEFLGCAAEVSYGWGWYPTNASDALKSVQDSIEHSQVMAGHDKLVEAVSVPNTGSGAGGIWAIVDANGHVVGSVEQGQATFMCENKPPYYTQPTVKYLKPGEGDE